VPSDPAAELIALLAELTHRAALMAAAEAEARAPALARMAEESAAAVERLHRLEAEKRPAP
jgi:hypothetical protein